MWTKIRDFWQQLDPQLKTQFISLVMVLLGLKTGSAPRSSGPEEDKAKEELRSAGCDVEAIEKAI